MTALETLTYYLLVFVALVIFSLVGACFLKWFCEKKRGQDRR